MPGEYNKLCMEAMVDIIADKYIRNKHKEAWIASPDLYSLWLTTSFVATELFADCINESGVLQNYCSEDWRDASFGSSGWKLNECDVEGGAANPPFVVGIIQDISCAFEKGVRLERPYCRCAVLTLGSRYGVMDHISKMTT